MKDDPNLLDLPVPSPHRLHEMSLLLLVPHSLKPPNFGHVAPQITRKGGPGPGRVICGGREQVDQEDYDHPSLTKVSSANLTIFSHHLFPPTDPTRYLKPCPKFGRRICG